MYPGRSSTSFLPAISSAMGTRVRGRDFTWDDRRDTENVVIINRRTRSSWPSYAHWPNNDPVGQVVYIDDNGSAITTCMRIIGVADDVHEESVEGENGWQIYYPDTQAFAGTPQLVVRTTLPPAQMANSVMSVLREAQPESDRCRVQADSDAGGPRQLAAPLLHDAGWIVCERSGCCWRRWASTASSRTPSRGRRRRSASAWRSAPARPRAQAGAGENAAAGGDWSGCRRGGVHHHFAPAGVVVVQHFALGQRDLHRDGSGAAERRSGCGLRSCGAGIAGQPTDRAARRVTKRDLGRSRDLPRS